MAEDKNVDNKILYLDENSLQVIRLIDQEIEKIKALNPRGVVFISVKDTENNKLKISRHYIAEIMPIYILAFLLIPEFSDDIELDIKIKEKRRILEKKIICAIELNGLKCSYVPDISIPFSNLSDDQKRRAEINIHEFIRVFESGRLYDGADKDIQRWKHELYQANERFKIIKGLIPLKKENFFSKRSDIQVDVIIKIRALMPDASRRQIHAECKKQRPDLFSIGFEAFKTIWKKAK